MSNHYTVEAARQKREEAEHEILTILNELQRVTGLDLVEVKVMLVVEANDDEAVRRPHAVRISLAV